MSDEEIRRLERSFLEESTYPNAEALTNAYHRAGLKCTPVYHLALRVVARGLESCAGQLIRCFHCRIDIVDRRPPRLERPSIPDLGEIAADVVRELDTPPTPPRRARRPRWKRWRA